MSFNGSGTFLINTAGQPVVSGTVISSTAFNALTADLATGLSTAITKDGQTTVTANIPMSTYKFTGLGVGSAATDSANLSQVQSTVTKLLTSVSGTDTITAVGAPVVAAYAAGQMFYFVATGDNTGAVTLNIDSLGAKAVTRDGSVALAAGDIKSGEVVVVVYDGTRFQVVSQLNSAGNATFANVSITSALNVGGVATFTANPVLSGGTANGVLYLNGSKVATSGSALTFDGTNFGTTGNANLGSGSKSTDTQLNFASDLGTQRIYLDRGTRSLVFYDATTAIENYRIAGITGVQTWGVGGSEQMRLTSTGLGIGTSSPSQRLNVAGNTLVPVGNSYFTFDVRFGIGTPDSDGLQIFSGDYTRFGTRTSLGVFTESMRLTSTGLGIGTSSPGAKLQVIGTTSDQIRVGTAATEHYRIGRNASDGLLDFYGSQTGFQGYRFGGIDGTWAVINSSGNLGLGVTPSAWGSGTRAFDIGSGSALYNPGSGTQTWLLTNTFNNGTNFIYKNNGGASWYQQNGPVHAWHNAPSGTAGNTISFTQGMVLDSSSRLAVGPGVTGAAYALDVVAGDGNLLRMDRSGVQVGSFVSGGNPFLGVISNHPLVLMTNSTERARITAAGELLVGKTSVGFTAGVSVEGIGVVNSSRDGGPSGYFNRNTNDGAIVIFVQDGTEEGSISVSGNTISYNAFAGSHWSQLQDGSKPDILRGTVMESINELCVWPDEQNERLPKSKVSDTAGSKKVYGVFMAWDNDWATTNDMYVTAVGAFICRVNASVTVQEGDLLESNGDGTARVQADDIIRSSTIGKVTSTVKTHQYDDGSYCVPTVLYCG